MADQRSNRPMEYTISAVYTCTNCLATATSRCVCVPPEDVQRLGYVRAEDLVRRHHEAIEAEQLENLRTPVRRSRHLIPAPPEGMTTVLYRWFDQENLLLYLGISDDLGKRFAAHKGKSSWVAFAHRQTLEWFPSRDKAEFAEVDAIKVEQPLFNGMHNENPDARMRAVAYLVEHGRLDLLAPALSRG